MTFFVVLALYGMVAASQQRTAGGWAFYFGLAALATGWAIGSKFAAILLLLPLLLTARHRQRRPIAPLFIGLGLTFSAFALTNPFALLDRGCEVISPALDWGPIQIPALDWGYCFLDNIGRQGGMVRGTTDFFFTRQYTGLTNYLYEIEMQVKWGMGPFLGLAAFIGLGWAIGQGGAFVYQAMQERHQRPLTHLPLAEFLLLAWILPYFLINGNFYVKFMRYMQPIIPFLMLYAAVWLCHTLPSRYRPLSVTLVLTTTTLYALSFVNLYAQPHPWETASHWIYTHIPAGATLLGELWDDDLPSLALEIDGQQHTRRNYTIDDLTWLSNPDRGDDLLKLQDNLTLLAGADYITIATNRVYGVVARLPERYPLSHQAHPLLFDGSLGYKVVFATQRTPNLGGYQLQPDTFGPAGLGRPTAVDTHLPQQKIINWGRVDESFTVYDQPLVIILKNTGRLTSNEMLDLFDLGE